MHIIHFLIGCLVLEGNSGDFELMHLCGLGVACFGGNSALELCCFD